MEGSITLIIGPMWSCKTSTLMKYAKKYSCLVVTTPKDNRYGEQIDGPFLANHDGYYLQSGINRKVIAVESCKDIGKHLTCDKTHVLIDEAQFIKDPLQLVEIANLGYKVICAGLCNSGNRHDEPTTLFPTIVTLLGIADEVIKLKGRCSECRRGEGILSFPKVDNVFPIGGAKHYDTLCRNCYSI